MLRLCSGQLRKGKLATPTVIWSIWSKQVTLLGYPIGATSQNLQAAIAGETHEYTDMYPGMSKTAREVGFDEIADWFETLAKAERSHANRFQKALDNLDG